AMRAGGWGARRAALLTLALSGAAVLNASAASPITVWYVKDRYVSADSILRETWNVHSRVALQKERMTKPFYWGQGQGADDYTVDAQPIGIDGDALTVMTRWSGDPAELEWVKHDLTSLPYHLRTGGDAAVIGVGGGRIHAHGERLVHAGCLARVPARAQAARHPQRLALVRPGEGVRDDAAGRARHGGPARARRRGPVALHHARGPRGGLDAHA